MDANTELDFEDPARALGNPVGVPGHSNALRTFLRERPLLRSVWAAHYDGAAPGERPDAHGVRGAYLRAARFLHPDKQKNLSPDARDVANECFLLLKDKYERHATALAARERRV